MTGSAIINHLRLHKKELQDKFSVRRIGVFGSQIRGDSTPASDIDVLVDFYQPTFDHYMDLKFYLEQLLGAEVDLVITDTLKPRLQPYISQEVIYA